MSLVFSTPFYQYINSTAWSLFQLDIISLHWLMIFGDLDLWALSSISVVKTHKITNRKVGGLFNATSCSCSEAGGAIN